MISFNELIVCIELGLIYGIVTVGVYLTFRVLNFSDLTCDGSFLAGAAVTAVLMKNGCGYWTALFMALIIGGAVGTLSGILNNIFKISNLLSGILVSFMMYSINLHIMDGVPNIVITSAPFTLAKIIVFAVLVCALIAYILITDFGLALRGIGFNQRLASNVGISVKSMSLIGITLSNGLIALGGALFSQYQGFADISQGVGTIIIGLGAIIIGEKILPYQSMLAAISACFIGSIIYRIIIAIALHLDFLSLDAKDLNLITGIMVILVMLIPSRQVKNYVNS